MVATGKEEKGSQADEHRGWEEIWNKAIQEVFGKLGIFQAYLASKEEGIPFPILPPKSQIFSTIELGYKNSYLKSMSQERI